MSLTLNDREKAAKLPVKSKLFFLHSLQPLTFSTSEKTTVFGQIQVHNGQIWLNSGQIWAKKENQTFTCQILFSLQKSIYLGRKVKNIIQNIVSKINLGQIGQKLDQNGQKTLFCLNACPKLASHQSCILKVNSGQKIFQFYHIPRKSYQLDIFKGFLHVKVGSLCISYCHMKTAPPLNQGS